MWRPDDSPATMHFESMQCAHYAVDDKIELNNSCAKCNAKSIIRNRTQPTCKPLLAMRMLNILRCTFSPHTNYMCISYHSRHSDPRPLCCPSMMKLSCYIGMVLCISMCNIVWSVRIKISKPNTIGDQYLLPLISMKLNYNFHV